MSDLGMLDDQRRGRMLSRIGAFYDASWTGPIVPPGPATGANAGAPGAWTPPRSNPPASYADLVAGNPNPVVPSPTTPWPPGSYVVCADGQAVYWDGASWQTGRAPTPLANIGHAGTPGTWEPPAPTARPPTDAEIAQVIPDPRSSWPPGSYIVTADGSEYYWNGTQWMLGRAPALAQVGRGGTPGTWQPPGSTAPTWDQLQAGGIPAESIHNTWPTGWYIVTGDGQECYWEVDANGDGSWVLGRSPGSTALLVSGIEGNPGYFKETGCVLPDMIELIDSSPMLPGWDEPGGPSTALYWTWAPRKSSWPVGAWIYSADGVITSWGWSTANSFGSWRSGAATGGYPAFAVAGTPGRWEPYGRLAAGVPTRAGIDNPDVDPGYWDQCVPPVGYYWEGRPTNQPWAGQNVPWTDGQFVTTADGVDVYWTGSGWVDGRAPWTEREAPAEPAPAPAKKSARRTR